MTEPQTPAGAGTAVTGAPDAGADDVTRVVATPQPTTAEAKADDRTRVEPREPPTLATGPLPAHDDPAHAPTEILPRPAPGGVPPSGTLPGRSAFDGSSRPPGEVGADAPARQVGRYLIRQRLGRGGMASVYRAHDPSIGRDVAIKFLHASLSEDDECRSRFLREARAAGGLSHPNIVIVHDVGEIDGRPYMAMELIEGATLSEALEKNRQMPLRDAVVIGIQLARALGYAHERGIVHRDIKPGNIMLLGDSLTIKVTDFGIAHMDDLGSEQRTQVGAVLGTPQYMSPEQAMGAKIDGRSDLFSAGIVLYQMLAGVRPFQGDSLVAVASKIVKEDPPSLAAARPDVPNALRRLVEHCLAKQPVQRFQSGNDLAEALSKVLATIDESARERDKPRLVPLRIKWALTMAAIVALVMGVTTTLVTKRQYAAMMAQVGEYGESLARFIAAQNAEQVLRAEEDDWVLVDVRVQKMMETRNFERITVVDRAGTVRVSSQAALVGKPYQPPAGAQSLGTPVDGSAMLRFSSGGAPVLGFDAPVLFQGKAIGRVALGIPEQPLTEVARLSITLMIVLAVVTVLAVAIAMYFVADWFAKPIRVVREALAEIARGRLDVRISEARNDEFGQLYAGFDAMAEALQQRAVGADSGAGRPAEPTDAAPLGGVPPDGGAPG